MISALKVGQPIWVASEGKVVDLVVTWVGARKAKAGPPHGEHKPVHAWSVFDNGFLVAVRGAGALSVGWSGRPVFFACADAEIAAARQALVAAKVRAEAANGSLGRRREAHARQMELLEQRRQESVTAVAEAEVAAARADEAFRDAEAEVARLEARKAAEIQEAAHV